MEGWIHPSFSGQFLHEETEEERFTLNTEVKNMKSGANRRQQNISYSFSCCMVVGSMTQRDKRNKMDGEGEWREADRHGSN
jgi:hypothetical protein